MPTDRPRSTAPPDQSLRDSGSDAPSGAPGRPHAAPPLEPGDLVRHPERADWGLGQVQSAVGARVTVNFEHAGKRVINTSLIALQPVPHGTGHNQNV